MSRVSRDAAHRSRSRKWIIVGAVAAIICIAIALGVGLGVGLPHHEAVRDPDLGSQAKLLENRTYLSSVDSDKRGFVPMLWNAEADAGPDFVYPPYFSVMQANNTKPLNQSCIHNGTCSSQLVSLVQFNKPRSDIQHILDNHYAAAAANLTAYGGTIARSVGVIGNGTARGGCQSYTTGFRADWNSTWSRLGLVVEQACDYDAAGGGPPGMQIGFATGARNLYYYTNYTYGINTYILNIRRNGQ